MFKDMDISNDTLKENEKLKNKLWLDLMKKEITDKNVSDDSLLALRNSYCLEWAFERSNEKAKLYDQYVMLKDLYNI